MSAMSSTIQVLTVEDEERTSKRTGNKWNHFAARCIVLDDGGAAINVGTIRRISEELRAVCKPGTYRADFSLQVPDFGQDKGDIVAVITNLTPVKVTPAGIAAAPAPAPQPVPAVKP